MKSRSFIYIFLIVLISACGGNRDVENSENTKASKPDVEIRDLDEIKEDGKLRVLITYSSTSYFLYKGQPLGFEYELLERLAEHLGLQLELIVADDLDAQFDQLVNGNVDLLADGMTITQDRKERVNFTDYLYLVKQVLVQKKPDNWRKLSWSNLQKQLIHDPIELIGDTVTVRRSSSYYERLVNLSNEIGGEIIVDTTISGEISTDEIIKMVAEGKIKYTVADDNLAKINSSYYPILDISVQLSFSQRIAWAVNKEAPELLIAINDWIEKERKRTDYYVIYNKYFKNKRRFKRRIKSDYYSINNNQISQYDDLIKKYASELGWDWRLLASQVYQESKFIPHAESWTGAKGLMQVMPATAKELGITDKSDPEQSLRGGTDYLNHLYERFPEVPDSLNRVKLTLAAYNCGYQHVVDAQRLAEAEGLDKNVWSGNVEEMLLALSYPKNYRKDLVKYGYVRGIEPVTYVNQIFERYEHYKKFIKLENENYSTLPAS
jgi:membrane-bound lytic murein transglycosylase F